MSDRYGASPETWRHYSTTLGLTADLLPVVSNPNATISAGSKMKGLGKTPSWYNQRREVAGIPKWTEMRSTIGDVRRWSQELDYGICLQTRSFGAIDIDVPDRAKADRIAKAISYSLPKRFRADSGKCLLIFKRNFAMPKRVIPVDGGVIEFLGDGQQFIAEGQHPSGARYEWAGSIVGTPELSEAQLDALWLDLISEFGTGEPRIARQKRVGKGALDLNVHDPVADWLNDNWEIYDVGNDGQLFIECPFADEHTSDSGPTSTAYFPAGTGGYSQGHYVCLHAHCAGREDQDFNDATGYNLAQFEALPALGADGDAKGGDAELRASTAQLAGVIPWPTFPRDKNGKIEASADYLTKALACADMVKRHLAYDSFKDEIIWAPSEQPLGEAQWRVFTDRDYVDVRIQLERRGFKPMGKEMLRDTVAKTAHDNEIDSAMTWLTRLRWDGVSRIDEFCVRYWGWEDTPYAHAVGRYIWTALAGRVLEPGVQADMVPILTGPQGAGKTRAIKAMAPSEDFYVSLQLDAHDDNTSRMMRGKLIMELEELRGLNSRAIEEIKAFVSRTHETWVPKFKEFSSRYARRGLMFGSTNEDETLADPTGERRWLPGFMGRIDVDGIAAARDQLWAEGAALFAMDGIDWQEAEQLAPAEHVKFKVTDIWAHRVKDWLEEEGIDGSLPDAEGYITISAALAAVGVPVSHQDRGKESRMGKALKTLGWQRVRLKGGDREWVYMRPGTLQ